MCVCPCVQVQPAAKVVVPDPTDSDEYTLEEIEEEVEVEEDEPIRRIGDWEECFDKQYNRTYYYNTKTGVSSWTFPKL